MADFQARKRKLSSVKRLDHDAVDARFEASLLEYGYLARQAGIAPEQAVERVRSHLLDGESRPSRQWKPPQRPSRSSLIAAGVALSVVVVIAGAIVLRPGPAFESFETPVEVAGPSQVPAEVAGLAELYVAIFLSEAGEGSESVLDPFVAEPVQMLGVSRGRFYVQNTAVVGAEIVNGVWQVRIGAQTLQRVTGGYADARLQIYQINLAPDGAGWLADGLPIQVRGL